MIQEFLAGRDLSNLIAEREPLAIVEKQRILASVADGLDYAHRRGVIHRDIKPSNIRILEDGGVKVMDFGIAKPVDETTAVTKKGVTVGSLGYMSPEQICGDPLGPEADIFLLGITAYELLSYRRPFRNDNLFRLMEMIVKEEPDPLIDVEPSVPAGLAAVVAKAMRKSPEERFSSASEMRDALWRGEA
jgi:serine/threonine-protein kinase